MTRQAVWRGTEARARDTLQASGPHALPAYLLFVVAKGAAVGAAKVNLSKGRRRVSRR